MKALLVVFSQTGNTLKLAKRIQDGITAEWGSCELLSLHEAQGMAFEGYDLVGLGCPAFFYKEPFNVADFIEGLPELKGKQWFVFASHGSEMGTTLVSMADKLKAKGIEVIGSTHVYADAFLPFYPHPTVTTGHPLEKDLDLACEFGKKMARNSVAIAAGQKDLIDPPVLTYAPDWSKKEAAVLSREVLARAMPKFSINQEKCVECGLCEELCPVDGIDISAEPPRIQEPCIYCFMCAKSCPECAIEADWSMLVQMAPANYARYLDTLNAAEARGEFQWMMDPKTLNFDDPMYIQQARKKKS